MQIFARVLRFFAWLSLCASLATASDLRQIGMVNIPGAPGFGQVAFVNGMLVMTHPGASAVDIFDPVRRRIVAQITGLQSPRGIAVDEQGGRIYVADHGANAIAVIGTDGWKVSDNIPLQGSPDALLLNNGKLYWTDAENGTVAVIDLATKQVTSKVDVGGAPRNLTLAPDRNLVFATVQDLHQVIAIDPQLKIVNRFMLNASQPTGLVYDSHSGELYVAVRYAVLAINATSGVEINRVSAPAGVDALWLDPGSRMLYAASEGSLLTIHADGRLTPADEIRTEVKGHIVAYDAAKNLVLVPGGREGRSRVQILRLMNSQQGGASDDARADVR